MAKSERSLNNSSAIRGWNVAEKFKYAKKNDYVLEENLKSDRNKSTFFFFSLVSASFLFNKKDSTKKKSTFCFRKIQVFCLVELFLFQYKIFFKEHVTKAIS